jgi:redox-sensitive bicupin YhaK (pirin superfamily)
MNYQTNNGELAKLQVRRNEEIFKGDAGIVRASLHFSFGGHLDPDNNGIGMLEVLNHDTLTPGSLWPMHHHRDIEAVSYVVKGEFEHADSLGNGGVLSAGGVQVMSLGRGAEHSERNHSSERDLELVQIWIVPKRFGIDPSVQQHQYTEDERRNRLLRIAKPAYEPGEGLDLEQDASVYVSHLEDGNALMHEVPSGHGAYLYVIQGRLRVNGERMGSGDAAYVWQGGQLDMTAAVPSELLLVDTVLWRTAMS